MQPLGLTPVQLRAYLERLFSSHDYRVEVEILDMDERIVGSASLLDGQINIQTGDLVRRTASLTISDPTGMLDYTAASTWSGSTIWLDRLIRITHTLRVPGVGIRGNEVTVTPFIGPPSAISRDGAEVTVECQDKTALAIRGASPMTIAKGTNAITAIRNILRNRTGEFRFRLGTSAIRTSRVYSVALADEAAPWLVATRIARNDLGMQLIYSCDGYVTLRRLPTGIGLVVPFVTSEATSSVDFTSLINWVRVIGKSTTTTRTTTSGGVTTRVATTTRPQSVARVTAGNLAPWNLARKGVSRHLPLLIQDDAFVNTNQTKQRAEAELARGSQVGTDQQLSCVPFFHADVDDRVQFNVPGNDVVVRLNNASIPLGPSEMSVGTQRWVSRVPQMKTSRKWAQMRKVTVTRKPKPKPKAKRK